MENTANQVVELSIKGMTCSGCTDAVAKALRKVSGVTGVVVDIDAGRARIEGKVERTALALAVENAGFDVAENDVPVPQRLAKKGGCCCG